jgi:hypothetical protein
MPKPLQALYAYSYAASRHAYEVNLYRPMPKLAKPLQALILTPHLGIPMN